MQDEECWTETRNRWSDLANLLDGPAERCHPGFVATTPLSAIRASTLCLAQALTDPRSVQLPAQHLRRRMSALFASLVSLLQTDRADGKAIAEMDLLGPSSSRRPTRTSANTHSSFVRGPRIFILQKISEALLRESSESRRFERTRSAAPFCAFRESLRFILQKLWATTPEPLRCHPARD